MKTKIVIKQKSTNEVLFEFECEGNTMKKTVEETVKRSADLRFADLRFADLSSALSKVIILPCSYTYYAMGYFEEHGKKNYIQLGCYLRTLEEWEEDFWNNDNEFPNDNSPKSNARLKTYTIIKNFLING